MDIKQVRDETPGVTHRVHLDNAGTGLMPKPVADAVKGHIVLEARIGGYEAEAQENERIEAAYSSVAKLIGAKKSEIAFADNATVAWQRAFFAQTFSEGERILIAEAEYAANYVAYLQMHKRKGCVIDVIPNDASGATDPQALEKMIDDKVRLIAITWIPTNGGLVNPAASIGKIARAHGIPYLLDACQAPGQMPVNVDELGCDFLSATGRKFMRGPRGTGFLYVRSKMLGHIEPYMLDHYGAPWTAPQEYEMRSDARRFETWERAPALHLGLGAAADYALDIGLKSIRTRVTKLADNLRDELDKMPRITVQDIGTQKCAIVTFTHEQIDSDAIKSAMSEEGINVSVSRAPSTLLDAKARNLTDLVRVSPHYYNSEEELEIFLSVLRGVTGR